MPRVKRVKKRRHRDAWNDEHAKVLFSGRATLWYRARDFFLATPARTQPTGDPGGMA